MAQFVLTAGLQVRAQGGQGRQVGAMRDGRREQTVEMANLFCIVLIDKAFNRRHRGVHGTRPGQGWQGPGQPAGKPPGRQQAASIRRGQMSFNASEVLLFCGQMMLSEGARSRVTAEGQHAAVDLNCTDFASVVAAQIGSH